MMYKVLDGETIYDVALKLYGSVDYAGTLCVDNNLSLNDNIEGLQLVYDASVKVNNNVPFNYSAQTERNVPAKFRAMDGMSIWDVCLNTIGGFEGIVDLAKSGGIQIIGEDVSGITFSYQSKDNSLREWATGIQIATSIKEGLKRGGAYSKAFDKKAYL